MRNLCHPILIIFVVFMILPLFIMKTGGMSLATEVMIWIIFAMGFNILLGYTGLPSFGHGVFFGVGAYACGLIQHNIITGIWIPILGSMLFCGVLAGLVGLFLAHKRGIYFSLLTIALTQMFFFITFQWDSLTGGEDGLMGIERYALTFFGLFDVKLEGILPYYYFVLIVMMLSIILLWKVVHSPFGSVLYAIKQNEVRAKYLGYNTTLYKWIAIVISGIFPGLAGALYAMLTHGAFAEQMHWTHSGDVVMMVIIGGGLTNFFGPVLGAVIFIAIRDVFSSVTEHWYLFYGMLIVFIIIVMPEGILGRFSVGKSGAKTCNINEEETKNITADGVE